MVLKNYSSRLLKLLATVGLVIPIVLFSCSGSGDNEVIDFSQTIPVPRPAAKSKQQGALRVAVGAMISPKETFVYYQQILDYISRSIGKESELIQRKTYAEINELFGKGEVDLAFICSGPYATGKEKYGFELLATPQVLGSHFYHAYLIVNKNSSIFNKLVTPSSARIQGVTWNSKNLPSLFQSITRCNKGA